MKRIPVLFVFVWIVCAFAIELPAQSNGKKNFSDVDSAYKNAQKGLQWGLSNIKAKKVRSENKLVTENNLIATVKIEKVISGIKLISIGFCGSTEVSLVLYRTFAALVQDGYLDKNSPFLREEE